MARRAFAPRRRRDRATLADGMIERAQALGRFDGVGMFPQNIPVGLFRFSETAESFKAGRMMTTIKRISCAAGKRQFDKGQGHIRATGVERGGAFGM